MGIPGVTMPPDPIQAQPTYASAKAAFEQLKPIRVLFDNGAGGSQPGQPKPAFEQSFSKFPIPNTSARFWYFANGSGLRGARPPQAGADSFTWNAHARPLTDFTGDTASGTNGLWTATPPYHWARPPAGSAASYASRPAQPRTPPPSAPARCTPGSAPRPPTWTCRPRSREIRPDGKETFVQNGWVRANERKLDASKSTLLEPVLSLRASDVSPMPSNRYVPGHDPALLRGSHLPRRLAHPRDDHGPQRRPADLVVRRDPPEGTGDRLDRPLKEHAVEPHPSGGAWRERADRPAAVPRPAGRAVPELPAVRQSADDPLTPAPAIWGSRSPKPFGGLPAPGGGSRPRWAPVQAATRGRRR